MLAHSEVGGGSRVVLLLHGLFARGSDMTQLAEQLIGERQDVRGLMPDLPGHGDSPPLPPEAKLASIAEVLVHWLDGLGVTQRVPVVAHSMGGRVALRAFELAPERFGPFGCIDTPPGDLQERRSPLSPFIKALQAAPARTDDEASMMEAFGRIMMGDALRDWIRSKLVRDPQGGYTWSFDREAMAGYRWRTMGEDLWPIVGRLGPAQLSVVAPLRSSYVRPEDRARYLEHGIEVLTQRKAGHDMHMQMPEDLRAHLGNAVGLT